MPRVVGEHEVERVHVGLPRVDPRQVLLEHVTRTPAPGANVGRDRNRSRHGFPRSRRLAEDARHPEAAVFGLGRGRQHLVTVETGAGDVGPEHVDERQRVRSRRNARGVERGDLRRVLEDRAELGGERVELLVGQREPRERATCSTSARVNEESDGTTRRYL